MINSINSGVAVLAQVSTARVGNEQAAGATAVRQEMPASGKSEPLEEQARSVLQQADRVADILARYLSDLSHEIQFRIDDSTGDSVMTVYDSQTDTVVRQIPSEDVLVVSRYLREFLDQAQAAQPVGNSNK